MVNSHVLNSGRQIMLYRTYTPTAQLSPTENNAPTKFRLGKDSSAMNIADTGLDNPLPIFNGTINDNGANQMTGSDGGSNTTDNTAVFKSGAQTLDNTAQNLIANDSDADKVWTIADLEADGVKCDPDKFTSIWFYVNDVATLDKFLTSGTALEIRIGNDDSNYYSKEITASELQMGWNWIQLGVLNSNPETGTVSGDLVWFQIRVTTNDATDEFVAGDVVYDMLRQWTYDDTVKEFETGYPILDSSLLNATTQCFVSSVLAVGFNIDSIITVNEDTVPKAFNKALTEVESKTDFEEFIFEIVDELL